MTTTEVAAVVTDQVAAPVTSIHRPHRAPAVPSLRPAARCRVSKVGDEATTARAA